MRKEFSKAVKRAALERAGGQMELSSSAERRLLSRVRTVGLGRHECWPWVGRTDPNGYGRIDIGGRPMLAHRVMYFYCNPEADPSLFVCHSCDNPRCCNLAHLWLGTQQQNVADMDLKGRRRWRPRRGEACNKAKLTAEQAIYIYNSKETGPVLAARYGISKEAVNYIKRGKNWAHVTGAQ